MIKSYNFQRYFVFLSLNIFLSKQTVLTQKKCCIIHQSSLLPKYPFMVSCLKMNNIAAKLRLKCCYIIVYINYLSVGLIVLKTLYDDILI